MPGVYGRGGDFEDVRERVAALVTRAGAAEEPEQLRFPPVLPRRDLETVGYLKSFPHLAGSIFAFDGHRGAGRRAVRARLPPRGLERVPGDDRARAHPRRLLPRVSRDRRPRQAGPRRRDGRRRRRLRLPPRALRRPGAAADVPPARDRAHRRARRPFRPGATPGASVRSSCWAASACEVELDVASDPFFGRSGRMLAASQREQELKFEVVTQIAGPEPTAVASFNYHQDHFASAYGIELRRRRARPTRPASASVSSGSRSRCSRTHGFDIQAWPAEVGERLWER